MSAVAVKASSVTGRKPVSVPIRHALPFVKWAGGKRGLMPEILKHVPPKFGTYFEPFVGGGALYFQLRPKKAVLNDANEWLMITYGVVRDNVEELIRAMARMEDGAQRFTNTRESLNRSRTMGATGIAACVIYLNKTCFNGLWRVNKKGAFNVPYDASRTGERTVCDEINLRLCARALRGCDLTSVDFEQSAMRARKGDFVYFDPPYVPKGGYADFTEYAMGGFGPEEQERLVVVARKLKARGVHVLLSNTDLPEVRRLYKGFKLHEVSARRSINSKASKRDKVGELLIVARDNPDALPFVAQLLGVPPCPQCDHVMRPGEAHVCRVAEVT